LIDSTPVALASYLAGLLLLAGALGVVLLRNIVEAAFALFFTFAMVAVLFLLLNAGFMFAVQLLLYATITGILVGAALLLTRGTEGSAPNAFSRQLIPAVAVAGALFLLLVGVVVRATWPLTPWPGSGTDRLARGLLTEYAVPFVALGVLFLAAMAGAVALALPDEPRARPTSVTPAGERGRRRRRRVRDQLRSEVKP